MQKAVQDVVLKMAVRVITHVLMKTVFHSAVAFVAELMRICSRFTCLIFMCAYVCMDVWDDNGGRGWRASEQSCLICAWGEKYPRVQCVMESRQNEGICGSQT